jgi:hypothetical protein
MNSEIRQKVSWVVSSLNTGLVKSEDVDSLGPEAIGATIDMARYQEAQARAEIDRCLELEPHNADAWVVRATVFCYGVHDLSNARRCITEALRFDPGLEKARFVLGNFLKDYGWPWRIKNVSTKPSPPLRKPSR